MNKVICDICGTSYPETAAQCPICGCVRPADAQSITDTQKSDTHSNYTYVRGGRFSKKNVRMRNQSRSAAAEPVMEPVSSEDSVENKSGKGLVFVAIVLLLAIIAFVLYLAVRYFMPFFGVDLPSKDTTPSTDTVQTTQSPSAPCTGIALDVFSITFTTAGEGRMLEVTLDPADTTDVVTFYSDNESVATVSSAGMITAVAPGKATISASCGTYVATCTVECTFPEPTDETTEATEATDETTEATEESTESTVAADEAFELNRKDITFNRKGDTWMIYDGKESLANITWSTDDENVATIENGRVTAVGPGTTEVHAELDGQKESCIIRCKFSDDSSVSGSGGGVSEDGGSGSSGSAPANPAYKLYNAYGDASDVTISVGDSFTLQLHDADGNYVSGVSWSVSNQSCCTVSDGVITGVGAGMASVTATYDGNTYTCIVRVG